MGEDELPSDISGVSYSLDVTTLDGSQNQLISGCTNVIILFALYVC